MTELATGENKQRQESDEINLKELPEGEATLLKDILAHWNPTAQ